MATTARLDLSVWRNDDVYEFPLRVRGIDLTDANYLMEIRLGPDVPGSPLIRLEKVTNGNAEGLRLAGVTTTNGIVESDLRIRINKTTRQALPYSGEVGDSARLAYALVLYGVTILTGGFIVLASPYASDAAPVNRPLTGNSLPSHPLPAAGALLVVTDTGGATVSIDGVDQLSVVVEAAEAARDEAQTAVAAIEPIRGSIIPIGTATLIGGNSNEWRVALPPGTPLSNFGAMRFLIPATPTGPVWITTVQHGRHRLNMLNGFPVPIGALSLPAIITTAHSDNGTQWVLESNSADTEEPQITAGIVLPDTGSTPDHWRFKSRRGFKWVDGATAQFFAPFTSEGPVEITIDGYATGPLRKAAGNPLGVGDIPANAMVSVVWPGASSSQNSWFVSAVGPRQGSATPAPSGDAGTPLAVDSPLFVQSDYPAASTVTKTDRLLRFVRPIADANNERNAAPNVRDRARMRASWYEINVRLGDATKRQTPSAPLVLVDGVPAAVSATTVGVASLDLVQTIRVEMDAAAMHDVEFVFPYEQPAAIVGRRVSRDAVFAAPVARPAKLLVTPGDSITQGFSVDSAADQWPHRLGGTIGHRVINHGYGGRRLVSADGVVYGTEAGDITIYMIGANDVTAHTTLADMTSRLNAFWAGFFGAHPEGNAAKLLMVSQTWMEAGDGGVPVSPTGPQYRSTMQSAVAAAVATYPNLRYKTGLDLTDGPGTTVDGTHPSSATAVGQIAPRLRTHLVSLGWVTT